MIILDYKQIFFHHITENKNTQKATKLKKNFALKFLLIINNIQILYSNTWNVSFSEKINKIMFATHRVKIYYYDTVLDYL